MSGGGGGGGRKRRHVEEEHENHERWLVTYADMLTVLLALFIVLFALSVVDKQKFQEFATGRTGGPGTGETLLEGGAGLQPSVGQSMTLDVKAATAALAEKDARAAAAAREDDQLKKAREKIRTALIKKNLEKSVRFKIDERGLVVTVVTDEVLFDLGSATLRPAGRNVLDAIAPALKTLPNPVTVEGHTDNLPIRGGGRFATNWELSTERATEVLRYVLDQHQVPAKRLSAAGYADQRPLGTNATPAGRSNNRRVEVIVRATAIRVPAAPAVVPAVSTPLSPTTTTPANAAPQAAADDEEN